MTTPKIPKGWFRLTGRHVLVHGDKFWDIKFGKWSSTMQVGTRIGDPSVGIANNIYIRSLSVKKRTRWHGR